MSRLSLYLLGLILIFSVKIPADDDPDSKFIKEAASAGLMEVELGKLAQNKAASEEVRNFGQIMEKEHSKANQELISISGKKKEDLSIIEKHQDNIEKLTEAGKDNFDKMYMEMMVEDHEEDISKFEEASKTVKDPELKTWIEKNLPVLKEHLNIAQNTLNTLDAQQASEDDEAETY